MLLTPETSSEFVIFVYLYFEAMWTELQGRLIDEHNTLGGRPSAFTVPEALTIATLFSLSGYTDYKHFYHYFCALWKGWFPCPTYKTFLENIHRCFGISLVCLESLLKLFRRFFKGHAVDSTSLPVCHIKRDTSQKVTKHIASKGYSTMGWFFSFKMHVLVSRQGFPLAVVITKGSTDDCAPLETLLKDIRDTLIVADGGYVSQAIHDELRKKGIHFFVAPKKTMKKLMTAAQHLLLRSRQIVETLFATLKFRMHMTSSLPRSLVGYFSRYISALLANQLRRFAEVFFGKRIGIVS